MKKDLFWPTSIATNQIGRGIEGDWTMALRRVLGFSDGELMRSDAKPCSRLMRHTAGICSVGGALGFWTLCRLYYGLCLYCFCCLAYLVIKPLFYWWERLIFISILVDCLSLRFRTKERRKFTSSIVLFIFILLVFSNI